MANKISHVQKVLMLEWFEKPGNKRMLSGASHTLSPVALKKMWQDLTEVLNSCGCGPVKTALKWRRTFTELRCHLKKKQRCILAEYIKNGGGLTKATPLTDIEKRYLKLFRRAIVDGLESSEELAANLETPEAQDSASPYRLEDSVEAITVELSPNEMCETVEEMKNIKIENVSSQPPEINETVDTPNIKEETPRDPLEHTTSDRLVERFESAMMMQVDALNNIAAALNRMADSQETLRASIVEVLIKFLNKK